MKREQTYYGFLDGLRGDNAAIDREKERLDQFVVEVSSAIKTRITPKIVPGLLWALALKELERISRLVDIPISNFAGHARYLRSLCAAVPFTSVEPGEDPQTDALLKLCEKLWVAMFHREMIDDLRLSRLDDPRQQKRAIAALTSLLGAVQGDVKYYEQAEERVSRIFAPFSADVIEPSIGISANDSIVGFRVVRETIPKRITSSLELMRPLHAIWKEYGERSSRGASDEDLDTFVYGHPDYARMQSGFPDGISQLNNILLFRPIDFEEALRERSSMFLKAFSFRPGSVNADIRTPYDHDEVRKRPFAQIDDDRFVLVDVGYCPFAPQRRLTDCFDTEQKLHRLNRRRDESLEDEAVRLFSSVISPDLVLRNYYIPTGRNGELGERDLLILKGKSLFIIESKARPLREVGERRDKLDRIATDVKRSIQQGYDQACDVIKYIRSIGEGAKLFNSDRQDRTEIAQLNSGDIEDVIPIVFLDSYYGLIATDLKPWISIEPSIGFPWVVDRDTLDSILLLITSFEQLQAYLLWRRKLHGIAVNEDEAVFAGFFLRHGPEPMPEKADIVHLRPEYADIFESEYFRKKGLVVGAPPQKTGPAVWTSIKRKGDEIVFKEDGRPPRKLNFKTRQSRGTMERPQYVAKKKIGRNDPCPCGSGKKYKKCCLRT